MREQRNKNANRTRIVRKAHLAESFFNFFSSPLPPSFSVTSAAADDEDDEEELEELEDGLSLDYQIGEDVKYRIVPRAIDFFTGKALDYEDFDGDEEDDFEGLDEDDEYGSDDDSEADSDDDVPVRRRGGAPNGGNRPA